MLGQLGCLQVAARGLGLEVRVHDREENLLTVRTGSSGTPWWFSLSRTPFNNEAQAALCADKAHFHAVLNAHVHMPDTLAFLDPGTDPDYQHYVRERGVVEMAERAGDTLGLPLVVKPNSGSLGRGVRLCHDLDAVKSALASVFDQKSRFYDYVALAQRFVPLAREYRVISLRGEPLLAYERSGGSEGFMARYWETGHCQMVEDLNLLRRLGEFTRPVYEQTGVVFAGLDVGVRERTGTHGGSDEPWVLFEANSKPYFTHILEAGAEAEVTRMYERLLRKELGLGLSEGGPEG
ncbi:MAG: ATP-grasp domain-containing protein [Gammaproteobacteria bacterium]